jgi:hypothetical protein
MLLCRLLWREMVFLVDHLEQVRADLLESIEVFCVEE